MDQFDTTPVDPRLARPVLPVANGAPAQPDTPAVLPRVPVQSSQPQQTQGLAFPQVGVQGRSPAQEKLANTQEIGSGISRIHNPVLKTLATVGDVLAGTFAPRAEQLIPGTEGNHALRLAQANNAVKGEQEQLVAPVERRLKAAQATEAESLPDLHQAQAELNQRKQEEVETGHRNTEDINRLKAENQQTIAAAARKSTLAQHGFKENEKGEIVPLEYSEMSESQQAVHDLQAAQAEQAAATAQLRKAQSENQPQVAALAQARLASAQEAHSIAARRLGLSEAQFEMRAHGTQSGQALPGAIETDQGQPVGTAFQQNVRPTGQERNKADLANSAHQQIQDLKSIVQRRPDIFGPAAGRKTDFNVWLGSQDPDAQAFRAARTIAGDHLAGVFGGRSEAALKALDAAIGHFKDNPKAVIAGLDQLDKANAGFIEKGTPRTVGSQAAKQPPGANVDPKVKAFADQFFGGDVNKAQAEIDRQRKGGK